MRVPIPYDVMYDPRFEPLTRAALEAYARSLGWVPYEGRSCVWRNPKWVGDNGNPFILTIVPDNAPEFYLRASDVIRQLSQYERKSQKEILDEIVALSPSKPKKAQRKPRKKVVAE